MHDIQPTRYLTVNPRDPAELISALPALLGFYPQEALVIAHIHTGKLTRLAHHNIAAPNLVRACLESADQRIPTDYVLLVLVSGGCYDEHRSSTDPIPHATAVHAVRDALTAAGQVVKDILWTPAIIGEEFWQSATDRDHYGGLPETIGNFLPAAAAELGRAVYPARPRAADQPIPSPEDQHRAHRIRQTTKNREPRGHADHLHAIAHALTGARDGHLPDTDNEIGLLTQAMAGTRMQDIVVAATIRQQLLVPARSLWLPLTRLTVPPEQTWPAALLGATAYILGQLPLARTALHIAVTADEDHDMPINLLWFMAAGGSMPQDEWLDWLTEHRPAEDRYSGHVLDLALTT